MHKLQIISTISPDGHKLWAARAPEQVRSWLDGTAAHRTVGPALPCDEAFWRLAQLQAPGPIGRLTRLAARLGGRIISHSHPAVSLQPYVERGIGAVQDVLSGRIVFQDRLASLLRAEGLWPKEIAALLDFAVYHQIVEQLPGVSRQPWGVLRCSRCGGHNVVLEPCLLCRRDACPLCTDCLSLGESRGCRILLCAPHSKPRQARKVNFRLNYDLTPAQKRAAAKLEEFMAEPRKRTLVWAACGAGKTEVTFPVIRQALSQGLHVLFAVPRQDVVRELAERFRAAFTGVEIAVHYGGQPWQAEGELVIATTHQVLHFYQRFGLAILDEMDAFPYHGNEMLRFGLLRALQLGGKLVEMSATPSSIPKRGTAITIPVRHHGYPLPEPEFVKAKPGQIPGPVLQLVKDSPQKWLIFVPTIALCEKLAAGLAQELGEVVASCHSRHPHRKEEIAAFRAGEKRVMVATAVLERGVTFPGVQVVVVDAHHPIYSRSALVQMAGRVGRSADQPTGQVIFCGPRPSSAVRGAQAMIRKLNEEAAELGLLRGDCRA